MRKLLENGRKWREFSKRHLLLSSRLAECGALKKLLVTLTPRFANLQAILVEESETVA